MNAWLGWELCSFWFAAHIYVVHKNSPHLLLLRMIIGIIITNSVNVITGRLPYTSNHIYQKIVNAIQSVVCKDELVFLYIGFNGTSDDSYGIYASIHWRHNEMSRLSMSTAARTESPQTNVILVDQGQCLPLQLLSSIELEICWKYQFPAKKRQNRLKILMEKPFQPSVTDVYSEIG